MPSDPPADEKIRRGLALLARLEPPGSHSSDRSLHIEHVHVRLKKIIGKGAFGEVWLADDLTLPRRLAVKILREPDSVQQARFENEALALARLHNSPARDRVVQIFARGEANNRRALVLEYLEGGSLADRLRDERNQPRPLPPHEAARLVELIARTVAELHRLPLIHRDLKPSNILLASDGQPKLADFGLARFPDALERITCSAEVLGTPNYMAPEQASGRNEDVGPAADVYSLGAILYECLTGRPPFVGANTLDTLEQVRTREPLPLRELNQTVPRDLEVVCVKCLQKKPESRYASAADLAAELARFQAGEPILARPPGPVERLGKLARRNPGWTAFLLASVVGCLVALSLALIAWQQAERARLASRRAERNAALRLAALDEVLQAVAGDRLRRAGQTRLQRELLERLAPRFEQVLELEDQDEETREQQGLAWNGLAVIRRAMHRDQEALAAAGNAESIFRALLQGPAARRSSRAGLAIALSHVGLLLGQQGKCEEALGKLQEASERLAALLEEKEEPSLRHRLALVENNRANCLLRSKRPEEAENFYRKAIRHAALAVKTNPKEIAFRDWQARALSNLALLAAQGKRAREARSISRQAVAIARQLAVDFPGEIDSRECLAVCLTNEGELLRDGGDAVGSLIPLREAQGLYEGLARQVPSQVEYKWGRAMALSNVGAALADGPKAGWQEAVRSLERAEQLYAELTRANPGNRELQLYRDENASRLRQLRQKRPDS